MILIAVGLVVVAVLGLWLWFNVFRHFSDGESQ